MSKLYKKYVLLKISNPKKIYLFESGIFYVFIHDDALLMCNILNLKLTNLNSTIMKCGFPVKSLNRYLPILKNLEYDIEIVPANEHYSPSSITNYLTSKNLELIINNFLKIDITSLSISQAFDLLNDLKTKFKIILGEIYEEKK